jgi:DNA invertase Pin-like site-specific DNA recombinase
VAAGNTAGGKSQSEYVNLGVSGSWESRPELNLMLAAAHARAFDAVVCWKLDRLGRSLKHLVTTIEDLSAYGVAFISLRDNLDLSTPSGRLMLHIIGAMAEFERELIKERVSAGMHAARTGLGLALSKRIVEGHRGRIRVRSSVRPGKSSTIFRISIPGVSGSNGTAKGLRSLPILEAQPRDDFSRAFIQNNGG